MRSSPTISVLSEDFSVRYAGHSESVSKARCCTDFCHLTILELTSCPDDRLDSIENDLCHPKSPAFVRAPFSHTGPTAAHRSVGCVP